MVPGMATKTTPQDIPTSPTQIQRRWGDGMILNTEGQAYLVRKVPLGSVDEARSARLGENVAEPIMSAFDVCASLAGPQRLTRRATQKSTYRDVKIMLVNLPQRFESHAGWPELTDYQNREFGDKIVDFRVLLFAVRLLPKMRDTGILDIFRNVVETAFYGPNPVEDYEKDKKDAADALSTCGLRVPSETEMRLAESWWNQGNRSDAPYLPHVDHMHLFTSAASLVSTAQIAKTQPDCTTWPKIPDTHSLAFAAVSRFDLPYVDSDSPRAHWASTLVAEGARCISITGKVEPKENTRTELRRMRRVYANDRAEREKWNKSARAEADEKESDIGEAEDWMASVAGTPSLIESSTVVAFEGKHPQYGYNPEPLGPPAGVELLALENRQDSALLECMLGSSVRANPHQRDLPSQTLAYSGLPDLSSVGDDKGALLGLTERGSQPSYISHLASTDADVPPMMGVFGATGSGKSMLMNHLADQWARTTNDAGERTPVIIFDPKPDSDFSAVAERTGGTTWSLDSLLEADGVFDPIRFSATPQIGVEMASSAILSVNPWGDMERKRWETPLLKALNHGVMRGATCTMQALDIAERDGKAEPEMVQKIRDVAEANPKFRALCGSTPDGVSLRAAQGITYVRVGSAELNLPEPGTKPEDMDLSQRITVTLIRNIVYGSMAAIRMRQGVLLLDEAWVFTMAGGSELQTMGRLARSMQLLPVLFTQKVTDALDAGLRNWLSRSIVLPIEEESEAIAACKLAGVEPDAPRLARIMAGATVGDEGPDADAPNWDSMRALYKPVLDPVTGTPVRDPKSGRIKRRNVRGTIGLYTDVKKRSCPVEVTLSRDLLQAISTNRGDRLDRLDAAALAVSEGVAIDDFVLSTPEQEAAALTPVPVPVDQPLPAEPDAMGAALWG